MLVVLKPFPTYRQKERKYTKSFSFVKVLNNQFNILSLPEIKKKEHETTNSSQCSHSRQWKDTFHYGLAMRIKESWYEGAILQMLTGFYRFAVSFYCCRQGIG